MNAPLLPQILLRQDRSAQADLDLATEGVLRYVWSSAWGDMLIESIDGVAYVNGQRVDAAPSPAAQGMARVRDTSTGDA
ncbi:hypothetical protein [Roseateles asaccharophilus]|uniref:Uncharacterized protein n=1 Tax=Roseateles asaccharophilus TaxID=582607 RepID=A0ABU2ACJ7_9BURK|nr:hypothetical protein [Roseateles asaccharophilus]MDR7334926.1 hypothetical protein [Roseateles asaccharophilus]